MDGLTDTFPIQNEQSRQCTLKAAIHCVGVGLHTGRRIALTLGPAEESAGVRFRRADIGVEIPARFDRVVDTRLCTALAAADQPAARVGTVEHVMAALAGCGVDNAVVELDGPEVPILDGSAAPFAFLIDCAGIREQDAARTEIEILRPIRVEDGPAYAEFHPGGPGFALAMSIEFGTAAIGRQALSLRLDTASFRHELSRARTFAELAEVDRLRAAGLGQGGSLANAVIVDGARVLNPGGLRMPGEFVRHKLLDAVGDLALAGTALRGKFVGHRSGHTLNNRLLRALFADRSAWRFVSQDSAELRAAA
jgi:UDP-3-O-[3-hydroxymyristoyl] N-acetylglucosamine deacetylase